MIHGANCPLKAPLKYSLMNVNYGTLETRVPRTLLRVFFLFIQYITLYIISSRVHEQTHGAVFCIYYTHYLR